MKLRAEKMEAVRRARARILETATTHPGGLDTLLPAMVANTAHSVSPHRVGSAARTLSPTAPAPSGGGIYNGMELPAHIPGGRRGSNGGMSVLTTNQPTTSNLVVEEAKRLEKIQQRQQKELAQMIDAEMRLAEMRDALERKREEEAARIAAEAEEKKHKKLLEAEERRVRELKRKLIEEEEEKKRQSMAAAARAKEKTLEEEQQRKAQERAREQIEKDMMRQQKAAEHKK